MTDLQKGKIRKLRIVGKGYAHIAAELGISINNVKVFCSRNGSMVLASAKYNSPSVGYMASYACFAYISISQEPTHSKPPSLSSPDRKPPMPANISRYLIGIIHPTVSCFSFPFHLCFLTWSYRSPRPRQNLRPVPRPILPR